MANEKTPSDRIRIRIAIVITSASLLLLTLKLFLQARFPQLKLDDPLAVGLVILAALPWLSQLLSSAKIAGQELIFREIEQQKVNVDVKLNQMLGLINNLVGEKEITLL